MGRMPLRVACCLYISDAPFQPGCAPVSRGIAHPWLRGWVDKVPGPITGTTGPRGLRLREQARQPIGKCVGEDPS